MLGRLPQMLWIHGQITPWPTMRDLLLPSLVATAVPVAVMCATTPELQGPVTRAQAASPEQQQQHQQQPQPQQPGSTAAASSTIQDSSWQAPMTPAAAVAAAELQLETSKRDVLVLSVGLGALLFVPVFKYLTGLPPYMGMLSGLGILWMVTDALHFGENKQYPKVQDAMRNLDIGVCWGLSAYFNGTCFSASRWATPATQPRAEVPRGVSS
jgi:hypothetical protein